MRITIGKAAGILRKGGIVAFPTETVYGLGANALDAAAVRKVFIAKGRPADNPLIVHVSDQAMLRLVVREVPLAARRLMRRFWPGPLTIVLPKRPGVPRAVTAGLGTVAVRMPDHPVALDLIRSAGVPVAAPSANRSGRPSPTTAKHVRADFPRLPIIDGGACMHGVESTVIDLCGKVPRILRQGAVTLEQLRRVVSTVELARGTPKRPASPGMKHRHYAPKLALTVVRSRAALERYAKTHPRAAVLCVENDLQLIARNTTISLGRTSNDAARLLYVALRAQPKKSTELVARLLPERGIGRAVNDRLRRAATKILH